MRSGRQKANAPYWLRITGTLILSDPCVHIKSVECGGMFMQSLFAMSVWSCGVYMIRLLHVYAYLRGRVCVRAPLASFPNLPSRHNSVLAREREIEREGLWSVAAGDQAAEVAACLASK